MNDLSSQEVYFIGIALPEDLSKAVAELSARLYATDKAMLRPLTPHITLLHPPSLQGIMPDELVPKIRNIVRNYLPLTVALEGIGFFGDEIAYITAQSHGLDSLQPQLVSLLPQNIQAEQYRRAFSPHITIAQVHKPATLDKALIERICRTELKFPFQFTVDSATYFRRILPREYVPEKI